MFHDWHHLITFFKFRFTCGQQLTNPLAPYAWDIFIVSISLATEYSAPVLVVHKLASCWGCQAIEAQLQIVPSFLNNAKQNTKSFKICFIFLLYLCFTCNCCLTDIQSWIYFIYGMRFFCNTNIYFSCLHLYLTNHTPVQRHTFCNLFFLWLHVSNFPCCSFTWNWRCGIYFTKLSHFFP
jgi:hypothetical protein